MDHDQNTPDEARLFTHAARTQIAKTIDDLVADEADGFVRPSDDHRFTDTLATELVVRKFTDMLDGVDDFLTAEGRKRLVNSMGDDAGIDGDGSLVYKGTPFTDFGFMHQMENLGKDVAIALAIPF